MQRWWKNCGVFLDLKEKMVWWAPGEAFSRHLKEVKRKALLQGVWQRTLPALTWASVHGVFSSPACCTLTMCPPAVPHGFACSTFLTSFSFSSQPTLWPLTAPFPGMPVMLFLNCNCCLLVMGFPTRHHSNRVASKAAPRIFTSSKVPPCWFVFTNPASQCHSLEAMSPCRWSSVQNFDQSGRTHTSFC